MKKWLSQKYSAVEQSVNPLWKPSLPQSDIGMAALSTTGASSSSFFRWISSHLHLHLPSSSRLFGARVFSPLSIYMSQSSNSTTTIHRNLSDDRYEGWAPTESIPILWLRRVAKSSIILDPNVRWWHLTSPQKYRKRVTHASGSSSPNSKAHVGHQFSFNPSMATSSTTLTLSKCINLVALQRRPSNCNFSEHVVVFLLFYVHHPIGARAIICDECPSSFASRASLVSSKSCILRKRCGHRTRYEQYPRGLHWQDTRKKKKKKKEAFRLQSQYISLYSCSRNVTSFGNKDSYDWLRL